MDAKRIAEIRESAAAVVALCGSRQSAFMSASEAIALCDLAAEAVAYRQACNEAMARGLSDEIGAAAQVIGWRTAEILAASTNENGKG